MTDTTHFGYRDVPVADKQKLVGEVFRSVAERYDVMNDLMSLGLHRLWKRYFAATAGLRAGARVLDLAGGTGDIAALALPAVRPGGSVVLTDINPSMLDVGRRRLLDRGLFDGLDYSLANAESLPFTDESFDVVTIAFGLRNVTDKDRALREMHRVLKLGGRALVLEFSTLKVNALKPLYDAYSFNVLPRLGKLIANDANSYTYLAESIRKHPDQAALAEQFRAAGFERVDVRNLSGGLVAIHSGYRLE
jgi:demethylmenaquinone methyltransferase / 2-methoxy-6-polyprenyl-1,4-benzoquinol methylase